MNAYVVTTDTMEMASHRWLIKPYIAGQLSRIYDAPDDVSLIKRLGYEGGIEAAYSISRIFSVSCGIAFAYDRFREDITKEAIEKNGSSIAITRQPEIRSLYLFKVPLLLHFYATDRLSFKTGVEPWLITNAVMYPGNTVQIDHFQIAIPLGISYDLGSVELGVKCSVGTEKIAGHLPNSLALTLALPIGL